MTGGSLDAHVVVARGRRFRLDVALALDPGDVVAVMGPDGAGTTTLLEAIAGIVRLSDGGIRIDGSEIATARRHVPPAVRAIAYLGREPQLFPHMTARANVAFGPRSRGVPRDVADADADEWLWRVGLPGSGAHKPAELSLGQQHRAALARALATDPKVLLLDDALGGVDAETAGDIRSVVQEQLHATRATAIVVTGDVVDAAALAHRLVIVEGGRIVQEGPVHDVLGAPATPFVAGIAGLNRLVGTGRGGAWVDGDLTLHADHSAPIADGGAVAALFRPAAVQVDPVEDQTWTGALRLARDTHPVPGTWLAKVVRLERSPGGVRVHTAEPAVAVDLPADSAALRGMVHGAPVRLRVDPADVRLVPLEPQADAAVSRRAIAAADVPAGVGMPDAPLAADQTG